MKNFNKLNFEIRFKELETKKFYRVTSIDFDEKVVTGIAIGGKEEKLFPMEKVRLSAFTRFYDRKNRKIFENMLVIAKLEDSSLLGSVINTRGIWCIYDYKKKYGLPLADNRIKSLMIFNKRKAKKEE